MSAGLSAIAFSYYTTKKQTMDQLALCEAPSTASRIRGAYENKIRAFAPPEKIFETFASAKDDDGNLAMTYQDILRCITPYNYGEIKSSEEQKEYLELYGKQIHDLLKFADADGNGTISFTEYYFFL